MNIAVSLNEDAKAITQATIIFEGWDHAIG
jgi:hypothetical protein